jgi:hypothetical protein
MISSNPMPVAADDLSGRGPSTIIVAPLIPCGREVGGDLVARLGRERLRPCKDHPSDAGLGSISEIVAGNAPHLPRGCIAQAWGVAETLRVWRMLTLESANA